MSKETRRLRRQFAAIERAIPATRRPIAAILGGRLQWVRLPIAILFIFGGFVSFLPVFGFWMLPLGLLLLAVDVPPLRPTMSALSIRTRRFIRRLQQRRARRRRRG